MAAEYIVVDRTTATNISIQIDDGQLTLTDTVSGASAEPIVEDQLTSSDHWIIFVDDGQIGIESTVTIQDDQVVLTDVTTAEDYILFVNDGQLGWELFVGGGTTPATSPAYRLPLLGVG